VVALLAQVNTDRADDPIGLLFAISVTLAVLAVLVAALLVLYFRATRPRRVVAEEPAAAAEEPALAEGPAPAVASANGQPAAARPARPRSPVL
jgi:hypothetical protein